MPKGSGKKGSEAKGKAKGEAKAAAPVEIDADPSSLGTQQIEEAMRKMQQELDKERQERNYYQTERDRIHEFWEIAKKGAEDLKTQLRNRDRELQDIEERHQVEIKVYKQKIKHLLYEHQNSLTTAKAEGATAVKVAHDDTIEREKELRSDQKDLRLRLKEFELQHEDIVKSLQREHDKQVTELRKDFEQQVKDIVDKYDRKMRSLRDDLELRRKNEMHEIEERKNQQMNALMKNHEKAFGDIKNYYNDITLNNLALINSLKESMEEMKRKEERKDKLMVEITNENTRLTEPLQKAKAQNDEMSRKLVHLTKDRTALFNAKQQNKMLEEEVKDLRWQVEIMTQRFESVETERDDLYEKFVGTIREVQQKAGFKNLILEKKLKALAEDLEKKEGQLNEVLAASNLDPNALSAVTRKLEDVLDSKNQAIKDLRYELARVCKAHNDVLRTYEGKMAEFGISTADIGFKPLTTKAAQHLGKAPAGLVSSGTGA
eukprot:Clim_evm17s201 gene=Clim_evmTU17s201